MTGPEPGDLADVTYFDGYDVECQQRGMRVKGKPDFWLLADGDDCNDDQTTCVRPLSVVPTDSLEAALESDETLAAAAYAWLLAEEAAPALLGTEEIVRVVVGAVAAAVRSAITKEES